MAQGEAVYLCYYPRPIRRTEKNVMMNRFLLLSGLIAAPVAAQDVQTPLTADNELVIESIIVTATRRERSVSDVPLAVSAYDAERIELSRVTDIMDLMRIAPSFHIATGQAESVGTTARIRGVGTNGDNPGLESAVGMYVDGVYRNRATVSLTELGSIERIEILRGPQGTLFGRNSSAGVVSVITARPDPEGSAYADLSLGSYGSRRMEAGLSTVATGPMELASRLDAVWFQRDGFLKDANSDRYYNDRDRMFLRGQLVFEPTDATDMRLIADHTTRDENCCAAVGMIQGPTAALIQQLAQLQTGEPGVVGIAFDPFARQATVSENSSYYQNVEESGVSLETNTDTRWGRFTSITAWRDWETQREMDIDFSALDLGERPYGEYLMGFETFSQEFRLNGRSDRADWLVGAYFADERLPYRDVLEYGTSYGRYADAIASTAAAGIGGAFAQLGAGAPALEYGAAAVAAGAAGFAASLAPYLPPGFSAPQLAVTLPSYQAFPFNPWPGYERLAGADFYGEGSRDQYEQKSRNWALFTHNSLDLGNDFELTMGLRYTSEDKSLKANLRSTDKVCTVLGQRLLGNLQDTQTYLGGVQAYAAGLTDYLKDLDEFTSRAAQAVPAALQQQIIQGAAQVRAGADQVLPGAAQLVAGGQGLLVHPDVRLGYGTLASLGCLPFVDPSLDGNYSGSLDESEVSGTVRLSRAVGEHLLYGGYSRGYKAGGFNMDRSGLQSPILTLLTTGTANRPGVHEWIFLPETVDAFELGGKFSIENQRAMLDVNLFHEKFESYQLTAFTGLAFEALNIPEVVSRGVEMEARGVLSGALELFGGFTYADVRFGDGPEHGHRAGRQLTHAPKWTGVTGATVRFPLGPLSTAIHFDARYTSEHNTGADLDAEKQQDAYTVVNARLIVSSDEDSPWTADIWVQNLLDEDYFVTVFDGPLQGSGTGPGSTQTFDAFVGDPRVYGVSLRYEF